MTETLLAGIAATSLFAAFGTYCNAQTLVGNSREQDRQLCLKLQDRLGGSHSDCDNPLAANADAIIQAMHDFCLIYFRDVPVNCNTIDLHIIEQRAGVRIVNGPDQFLSIVSAP
jgi:hypothetical protein